MIHGMLEKHVKKERKKERKKFYMKGEYATHKDFQKPVVARQKYGQHIRKRGL